MKSEWIMYQLNLGLTIMKNEDYNVTRYVYLMVSFIQNSSTAWKWVNLTIDSCSVIK